MSAKAEEASANSAEMSPPEPSIPEPEIKEEGSQDYDSADIELAEYEEGYIQLGDFEYDDASIEQLEEAYGDADIDGVIYHGDLTKAGLEEGYEENTLSSYENLNEIGDVLDTEVYIIPGNNDPDSSELLSGRDRDAKETDGRPGDNRLEQFADYLEGEGYESGENPHSAIVGQLENLVDARSMDAGENLDLIFMGNHFDPELNEEAYKAIFDGPGVEEFYEEEDLEEIASYLEDERSQSYPLFEKLPLIGSLFKYAGNINVDADEISLEDVPGELMAEGHEKYREAVDELEEEYGDQIEAFENLLDELSERIEGAENPALINHSVPFGKQNPHGSMVLREAVKEYGEELEFVSGGHIHSPGIEEMEGTDIVNSAGVVTEIGVGEQTEYGINREISSEDVTQEQEMPETPEEAREAIEAELQRIDNLQSNPELEDEEREQLKQMQEQLEAEKQRIEEAI